MKKSHKTTRLGIKFIMQLDTRRRIELKSGKNMLSIQLSVMLLFFVFAAAAGNSIRMGITQIDGHKYNAEYAKYSKVATFFKENGINSFLIDYKNLSSLENLKKYNVILLRGRAEGVHLMTPEITRKAEIFGNTLKKYVQSGGSILLLPQSVRYANDQDEKYWNTIFKPFDAEILHEGVFDLKNQVANDIKPNYHKEQFFYTENIVSHPAVKHVRQLWLPLHSYHMAAGTPAMKYGPEWTVVIRGEKSAKSFLSDPCSNQQTPSANNIGTYKTSPPIVAVRALGKGRVACLPLDVIYTGQNYGNKFWSHIVENAGDPESGRKSDGMKLIVSLAKWLGQSNLNNPTLGTAETEKYNPVKFAESCNWDNFHFTRLAPGWWKNSATGILGAHSSYSDGHGSVAEYVKAAKAAGLSYIVFTDPLELLTPQKLENLKSDCKKHSSESFYACPGVEFTDSAGIRWATWGERVVWPANTKKPVRGRPAKLWDEKNKIVLHYGAYAEILGNTPIAVIDYSLLRKNNAFPENMWWFFNIFPYAFDGNKLIADNTKELQFALRDLRYILPMPYTKIKAPGELVTAKKTALAGLGIAGRKENFAAAIKMLNSSFSRSYAEGVVNTAFVSCKGFVPVALRFHNNQMEQNWQYTRGAQRIRGRIDAFSEAGIREVKLLDPSNHDVIRRFLPAAGTKNFTKDFELVHDKQHWVIAEVTDCNGAKSYSNSVLLFCYKQGLFRCGDNLNILGPLGMYWHPDRNQAMHFNKDFRNAELLSIQGWDRGGPDCPGPIARPCSWVNIQGVGEYPPPASREVILGKRMDVKLGSYNIQIVDMKMDNLMEKFDNPKRPGPSFATISRKIADNEYFERFDRMISPMDRMDHFIAWNHRRYAEGIKNYKGDYMWHEGYFKFKKDVVLQGSVPIPLGWITMPFNPKKGWGNVLVVKNGDQAAVVTEAKQQDQRIRKSGRIGGGGYISIVNNPIGYIGILVPRDYEMCYKAAVPGRLYVGIGRDGQKIKAGTILKYAFIAANITDDRSKTGEKMAELSRAFNLDGKGPGYPITVKTGKLLNPSYFLTIHAQNNEAVFTAGPQSAIGIDLPIKVQGVQDNGCAAIYSSNRPWFRFVSVLRDTAYFQEPVDRKNTIWAGNVFVAENNSIKLTLVNDGITGTRKPFLEIHNPTDVEITTKITSPPATPEFGGKDFTVKIPAGSSVIKELKSKIKRNLLTNGSFEKGGGILKVHRDLLIKKGFILDFKNADWPAQWQVNNSTQPCKVSLGNGPDAQNGSRYIKVAAGPHSVHINPSHKPFPGDRRYQCTFFARGTPFKKAGSIYPAKVRFSVYTFKMPAGKWYGGKQYKTFELSKDWKEFSFETTRFKADDGIIPAIELTGNCDLDNVIFTEIE